MRFPRPEYWSELPFPLPGDLPNLKIEPVSLTSPALAGGFFTTSATRETQQLVGWTDLQPSVQTDSTSPDSFIHWEYSEQILEKQETHKYLSAYNSKVALFFSFQVTAHFRLVTFNQKQVYPGQGALQHLETLETVWAVMMERGLLVSSGWGPGMLLHTLQYPGQHPLPDKESSNTEC